MKMTLNEIYDSIKDFMEKSLCVSGEAHDAAVEALDALRDYMWRPVTGNPDDGLEMPKLDEDGFSNLMLLSFANTNGVMIGQYREDELGGNFFEGETTDEPLTKFGLIVNAWAPLPEPYAGKN